MKRIYTYFFLMALAFSLKSEAKRKYEFIYKTCLYNIELLDVNRADSTTTLFMKCFGIPGENWTLPKSIYLCDEEQRRYPLRSMEGVGLGSNNKLPISGVSFFTLVFEAIPKHVKFFDMLSANQRYTTFGIWGIHDSGYKLPHPAIQDDVVTDDSMYVTHGTANIKVKMDERGDSISSMEFDYPNMVNMKTRKDFARAPSGEYVLSTIISGSSWSHIVINNHIKIPVFVVPGDTITIHVTSESAIDKKITYDSTNGNNLMPNLMNADPMMVDWQLQSDIDAPVNLDTLYYRVSGKLKQLRSLHNYLAWKYRLSATESHLLKLALKEHVSFYLTRALRKTLLNMYSQAEIWSMDAETFCNTVMHDCFKKNYSLLLDFSPKDYSYFALPDKSLVRFMSNLPLAQQKIESENQAPSRYILIEQVLGEKFDDKWLERMGK